jgi:hypothetical protein
VPSALIRSCDREIVVVHRRLGAAREIGRVVCQVWRVLAGATTSDAKVVALGRDRARRRNHRREKQPRDQGQGDQHGSRRVTPLPTRPRVSPLSDGDLRHSGSSFAHVGAIVQYSLTVLAYRMAISPGAISPYK